MEVVSYLYFFLLLCTLLPVVL